MNLEQLYKSNKIVFSSITGSHSYGLNVETSDEDMVGVFVHSTEDLLKFYAPPTQVSDAKNDIKYYELKEVFTLLLKGSPNLVEMLYIPEQFHKETSPLMEELIKHRDMFVSLKCYYSFVNYAYNQIKKSRGQNKWINNPKPKEAPKAEDYMYWIPTKNLCFSQEEEEVFVGSHYITHSGEEIFPCRPLRIETTKGFKVARIEHGFNTYRMYFATAEEEFFKTGKIECTSISKEEERGQFAGILNFNEVQYKQDTRDWKNYWGWIDKRNEARWIKQESGELDFDAKNMLHCMRLLRSGLHILKTGEPKVFFEGEEREYLLDVRNGKFTYDKIMEDAQVILDEIEIVKDKNALGLPKEPNRKEVLALYEKLRNEF